MRLTQLRVVGSGSTIEIYKYNKDHPLAYDFQIVGNKRRERIKIVDEQSRLRKIESRKRSLQRTKTNLRRLVNTNAWMWEKPNGKYYLPTFATFTFKEDIQDVKTANWFFSAFVKRLNEYVHGERKSVLRYVTVPEFQERGTVHFHSVFFNLPYVLKDSLEVIWGNGFVDIKAIKHVDNVGAYITKYMAKGFGDDRLDGLKRYSSSRGLIRPTEIRNENIAEQIVGRIPKKYLVREKEFESQHQGKVIYRQYKLGKHMSLADFMPKGTSV